MSFGSRLKEARKKAGFTQKALATKLGVSASMIAQYETGKRNPKKETLAKIASVLKLSYSFTKHGEAYFYEFVDTVSSPECEENRRFNERQYKDALSESNDKNTHVDSPIIDKKPTEDTFLNTMNTLRQRLNDAGQDKAIEQVEMLTKIPEYRKEDTKEE